VRRLIIIAAALSLAGCTTAGWSDRKASRSLVDQPWNERVMKHRCDGANDFDVASGPSCDRPHHYLPWLIRLD
jgi:hypothetical protein